MKKTVNKVLAAICAAALVIGCVAVTAFAAAPEWTCTADFTKTGTAFTPAKTGTKYAPITLDVTDSLKNMLGTKDSVKAGIRFDYKVTLKEGITSVNTPNTILKGTLASGATYAGEHFALQGGTAYWPKSRDNKDAYPKLVIDGKAHTYSNEITLTKADIENFSKIELVLWKIENIENFAAIEFSNTQVFEVVEIPENTLVWVKGGASADPVVSLEDGKAVFTQNGVTAGYTSIYCDVLSAVKAAAGDKKGDITLAFDYKAALKDGNTAVGAKVTIRPVLNKDAYKGEIFKADGSQIKDDYQQKVNLTADWQHCEFKFTLNSGDISDAVTKWNLCFTGLEFAKIDTISVKNTSVTFTEEQVIDKAPASVDIDWTKGLAGGGSENTEDGVKFFRAIGIDASYMSPTAEILSAIKTVMGDKKQGTVNFSFKVRVNGGDTNAKVVLRADKLGADIKGSTKDTFKDFYKGKIFSKNDGSNVIGNYDGNNVALYDGEWEDINFSLEINENETDASLWEKWNLCFSSMAGFNDIESIDVTPVTVKLEGNSNSTGTGDIALTSCAAALVLSTVAVIVIAKKRRMIF